MTVCEQLSDRMPAVARHEAAWSVEEDAHLASCPECRLEWELVTAAAGLGRDVAAGLDPHHVSERVLGRLRADRRMRVRRVRWALGGLAAAAAAALVVWTAGPRQRLSPPSSPAPIAEVAQLPLPELDSLGTPELQAVLRTLDAPIGTSVEGVDTTDLDGLDTPELQHVLDALEG
jgi:predicted anti-sigma-YlaC factor YlaD